MRPTETETEMTTEMTMEEQRPEDEEDTDAGVEGPGGGDDAPRIEAYLLPARRPAVVGVMTLDRAGLVELARRRGVVW